MDGMAMQRVVNASESNMVFAKAWMWKKQMKTSVDYFHKMKFVNARILEYISV